jgi:hypothetical protein
MCVSLSQQCADINVKLLCEFLDELVRLISVVPLGGHDGSLN